MNIIFDLDHTVIDSSHRQLTKADGSLDLDAWRDNCTAEMIHKDKLLPLAAVMRRAYENGHNVIICTARVMSSHDIAFLASHNLRYTTLLSRAEGDDGCDAELKERLFNWHFKHNRGVMSQCVFFDDNKKVLAMAKRLGMEALDAVRTNQELIKDPSIFS